MTVKEIIALCGGYNFNYTFLPRERISYFYQAEKVFWYEMTSYMRSHKEILSREVSHVSALDKNHFQISYYVTKEDIERIQSKYNKA